MSGKGPEVSVIIPTYNRAHVVGRAIESVLNQTYREFEIIVVDDGSTDNTKELIEDKYGKQVNYVRQPRKGAPAARNLGFRISRGKFVNFLDSDDYFLPENLEKKVRVLERNPAAGWVYSDSYYTDEERNFFRRSHSLRKMRKKIETRDDVFDIMFRRGGLTNTNTVMMRRECMEKTGGFDERLTVYQDVEFFLRVARHFKAKYIHEPLCVRVRGPFSITSDRKNYYHGASLFIDKITREFPVEVRELKWLRKCRRWRADICNYSGLEYLENRKKRKARGEFLRSIRTYPLQGRVYLYLLKSLLL
ncbi:MAG: glycosyltransferase [Candidatus Omnitrophica bacterium]|nr:glycosyltransferase [Candidatus Omnitrophota bacterium]